MVEDEETTATPPAITKLRTVAGPMGGGTRVVVEGCGFVDGCEVKVDRVPVKAAFLSATEVAFTTLPRNLPGSVDVDVINPDGQRTLLIRAYEYCMAPVLTGVEP
ncbi:MAG TPA: IPT/TIG domain-containing protein, partial [Polyangiaceae bacterium]